MRPSHEMEALALEWMALHYVPSPGVPTPGSPAWQNTIPEIAELLRRVEAESGLPAEEFAGRVNRAMLEHFEAALRYQDHVLRHPNRTRGERLIDEILFVSYQPGSPKP